MSDTPPSRAKVTFVGQTYYPDSTSTSQLFQALLERMVDRGYEIDVICGFPSGKQAGKRAPRREVHNGVTIRRCGLQIDHKKSMAHRLVSYLGFLTHMMIALARRRRGIVFGISNPPFNAPLMWLASRVFRFRYQYMLLDGYPEGMIALGSLNERGIVTRLWKWANRKAYHAAETVVVLGRDMIPVLGRHYEVRPEQCVYLPHWSAVEPAAAKSFDETTYWDRLGVRDKFIVQYSGNMGLWHDIESLVRAADRLRDEPVHFLMIGGGIRREKAEQLTAELGLDNMSWHDFVPLDELDESLAYSHAALISLREGLEGVAVPCKLYGIMASGRAVVAHVPPESEVAMTVEENRMGIVADPGDVDSVVRAIKRLAGDPAAAEEMGRRGRRALEEKYLVDNAVEKFEQLWANN